MPVRHFADLATLPRVRPHPDRQTLDLVLPFAVPPRGAGDWVAHIRVDEGPVTRVAARPVTEQDLRARLGRGGSDGQHTFEDAPAVLMARRPFGGPYVEATVNDLHVGARVRYRLARAKGTTTGQAEYEVVVLAPEWVPDEIVHAHRGEHDGQFDAARSWVLHHRRDAGLDQFRLDLLDVAALPLPLVVDVAGTRLDLRQGVPDVLPLIDASLDSVTFAVPARHAPPAVTVRLEETEVAVDLTAAPDRAQARVMFIHFAIQGLNDYFAGPNTRYDPPRSYAQTTMRDESATFTSRPGSPENRVGDGYAMTIEAHRRLGQKHLWGMNAGLLDLLAFDCPEDLLGIRDDVAAGLLEPVVTAFGAHRLPYYRRSTNEDAVRDGIAVLDALVGAHGRTYYPDSRIYKAVPEVADVLRASGLQYLVLDAETALPGARTDPPLDVPGQPAAGDRFLDGNYLWRDERTGMRLLLIDSELREGLYDGTALEQDLGKLPLALRAKFLAFAVEPVVRRGNLVVYSDDADKASGNGWFDGVKAGGKDYNKRYQAALTWFSRHPWMRVVGTGDLGDDDVVGTADIDRATDPSLERPPGPPSLPSPGLCFDQRVKEWRDTPAAWFGETLGDISDRAELAVETWPAPYRGNQLFDLARLHLQMCLHESQWSKSARGSADMPEDFVVAETLQMRHVHVYLAASAWAGWAAGRRGTPTRVDRGPLVELVAGLDPALSGSTPPPWRRPDAAGAALQWDHDPNALAVLYNDQVLVVVDVNGGRVVNVFAMHRGRPCSVSGTFKAHQFLDADWSAAPPVTQPPGARNWECDGIVLQNDVWTPNHAYVAGDVASSQGCTGAPPAGSGGYAWYYPDNLNRYDRLDAGPDCVRLRYGPGTPPPTDGSPTTDGLDALLSQDRQSVVTGTGGPVVWHDVKRFGAFVKTLRLHGRTLSVQYDKVPSGHLVSNELSLDLWRGVMRGERQVRTVADDRRSIGLMAAGGAWARLRLGEGCQFSPATLARTDPPSATSMRLRRVLTDCLEVEALAAGSFDYAIDF